MSKIAPNEITVHSELEKLRPLSEDRLDALKNEEIDESDLNDDELEYFEFIKDLARDIDNSEQLHPALVTHKRTEAYLVSGYGRYLACKWSGNKLRTETMRMDEDEDIFELIFRENENRIPLDSYERAKVIAKRLGLWDDTSDKFLPPSEADQNMTLSEFADEVGKTKQAIWQFLSPVRQNKEMRDDFGDEVSDSSFQLIESIADDESEEYSLAQALQMSEVSSHRKFKDIVQDVRQNNPENVKSNVVRRLTGYEEKEENDGKGELSPEQQKPKAQRLIEQKEQERREQEREQKEKSEEKLKQRLNEDESGADEDVELEYAGDEADEKSEGDDGSNKTEVPEGYEGKNAEVTPEGKVRVEGEFGTTLVDPDEDEKNTTPVQVEIDNRNVVPKIHEEADERGMTPAEVVTEKIEMYYGLEENTPMVSEMQE